MRQVASGIEGVTTLNIKRDGFYQYDVVYDGQTRMDRGGWMADDSLTLTPSPSVRARPAVRPGRLTRTRSTGRARC